MTATKTLAQALVAAQKDMPAIEANTVNPHFKSKFVSLDHLLAKALPVLNKHGIAVVQFPSHNDLGAPTLTTTLIHESGEQMSASMPLFLPKQDPQGQGSAITYARRYAIAAALGISGEKDDDGQSATEAVNKPPAPKAVEQKPAPEGKSFAIPSNIPASPDQLATVTSLIPQVAAAHGKSEADVLKGIVGDYGKVEHLSGVKADELIGKLNRWKQNAKVPA